jgi:hypothetical protein
MLVMMAAGGDDDDDDDDDGVAGAIAVWIPLLRSEVMVGPLLQSSGCEAPLSSLCTSELVDLFSSALLMPSAEGISSRVARDARLLNSDWP